MASSSGKVVPRLPSLDSPSTETPYQVSPTDLRSSHYAVIPPVRGQNSNQMLDYFQQNHETKELTEEMPHLLPDIGEPHPCPYFLTPDVDLRPQKWSTTRMKDGEILKMAKSQILVDNKFGKELVGMLLMEIIEEDYAEEIVHEVLNELKT